MSANFWFGKKDSEEEYLVEYSAKFDSSSMERTPSETDPYEYGETSEITGVSTSAITKQSFAAVTWVGNGTSQTISGLNFEPAFVWMKNRDGVYSHLLFDQLRGAGQYLATNNTANTGNDPNSLTAFTGDGFSVGTTSASNQSGADIIAWCWSGGREIQTLKPTSATATNAITSQVSANPESGFSVVTATCGSGYDDIAHGLGSQPKMIIAKCRSAASAWYVNAIDVMGAAQSISLNTSGTSAANNIWTSLITDEFFRFYAINAVAAPSDWVYYCFANVDGVQKVSSYTGNGTSQYVNVGFRPDFLLLKNLAVSSDWYVLDTTRGDCELYTNSTGSEVCGSGRVVVDSTGFTITASVGPNNNGQKIMYLAVNTDATNYNRQTLTLEDTDRVQNTLFNELFQVYDDVHQSDNTVSGTVSAVDAATRTVDVDVLTGGGTFSANTGKTLVNDVRHLPAYQAQSSGIVGATAVEPPYALPGSLSLRTNESPVGQSQNITRPSWSGKTWTWSCWIKIPDIVDTSNYTYIFHENLHNALYINPSGTINLYYSQSTSPTLFAYTNEKLDDPSKWYHIVVAVDSSAGPGASSNDQSVGRLKMWLNGVKCTYGGYGVSEDADASFSYIGSKPASYLGNERDGALYSDIHYVQNQQLDASHFGEYDGLGNWVPKEYTGTYTGQSFHFPMNSPFLAEDTSGLGNHGSLNLPGTDPEGHYYGGIMGLNPAGTSLDNANSILSQSAFQDSTSSDGSYIWVKGSTFGITWSGLTGVTQLKLRHQRRGGSNASVTTTLNGSSSTGFSASSVEAVTTWNVGSSGTIIWEEVATNPASSGGYQIEALEFVGASGTVNFPTQAQILPAYTSWSTDSPSNYGVDTGDGADVHGNYCTWNPLEKRSEIVLSDGNLYASSIPSSAWMGATFASRTGKWYYEVTVNVGSALMLGVADYDVAVHYKKEYTNTGTYYYYGNSGRLYVNGTNTQFPNAVDYLYSNSDVIGIAFDCDNGTVNFYRNGSKVGGSSDSITGLTGKFLGPSLSAGSGSQSCSVNFGQKPFKYSAPAGYNTLNTSNL